MKKQSFYFLMLIIAAGCGQKAVEEIPVAETETVTPVTVVSPTKDSMTEFIELNATSSFMQQSVLKASANGYITLVTAQIGKSVSAHQQLFRIQTKESQSIGNTINLLDSTFKFSGTVAINAGTPGFVTEVNHQAGDYVQEGEQLAVISDSRSFVFILNLPYELRNYLLNKKQVSILLPDGKKLQAAVGAILQTVDSASQTQRIVLTVKDKNLPANLIGKVRVEKTLRADAISLPRQAVLTDETQEQYWVMKLIDSSTAVKVNIKKGIETNDRIEIVTPLFTRQDRFLLTGNYGLPDTAKVLIKQE